MKTHAGPFGSPSIRTTGIMLGSILGPPLHGNLHVKPSTWAKPSTNTQIQLLKPKTGCAYRLRYAVVALQNRYL